MQPDSPRGFQEARAALDHAADAIASHVHSARAARPVDRDTLIASLDVLLQSAQAIQEAIASLAEAAAETVPEWKTREELDAVVDRLAARAEERAANRWRLRLQQVARALAAGRVVSRRSRRLISSLDSLRSAAVAELSRVSEDDHPLVLPGPSDGVWLDWVFGQSSEELETLLTSLHDPTPNLYQFLLDLNPDDWQASSPVSSPTPLGASPIPSETSASNPALAVTSPAVAEPPPPATPLLVPSPAVPYPSTAVAVSKPVLHPAGEQPPPAAPRSLAETVQRPPPAAPPVPPRKPVPQPVQPAPEPDLASDQEILARCVAGDYLRAALLAAGRAFGGMPEGDPSFEALLVAHYVGNKAEAPPWPEWCYDPVVADGVAQEAPNSARLTFLAAQCQLARGEGVADPIPESVGETLLDTFNDLHEVRNWLAAFREAINVPGLWEQVSRPAPRDPTAEYGERRRTFAERYESGLLHRSDKAAYIRRQDHYLSRQRAFRLLHERLQPMGPAPVTAEEKRLIESWLEKKPEWVTEEWLKTTERVSGTIKLHGNQRVELVHRATTYLDLANRAWRAARELGNTPVQLKDVERLRKQLRDWLPDARSKAQGQPWGPLFHQLTGRFPS